MVFKYSQKPSFNSNYENSLIFTVGLFIGPIIAAAKILQKLQKLFLFYYRDVIEILYKIFHSVKTKWVDN